MKTQKSLIDKQLWHSISMRNIHTIHHVDADTYFDSKRAMGDIVDIQNLCLDGIFDVMDNE